MIDNVQLTNRCCPAPENLQADLFGTEVTLTWDGDPNGNYEVMYRNAYTDKDAAWNVLTNQTSPCQFTVTEKGRYTFWVRHICDTTNVVSDCPNVSKWSTYQDFLVVTNEGCINFVDLHSNLVQATYGPFANHMPMLEL